jgi:hypothetical protein
MIVGSCIVALTEHREADLVRHHLEVIAYLTARAESPDRLLSLPFPGGG